ncbi:hypothetical protein PK35_06605 [Tamlana nanhaiensis]|uniref:Uncharacterized protein n=1 Tax=Neotamlana nanhaiensis TaxID=1382798 RepID=A0A0D7W3A6_9FLAO|nr:hypothetical protein [Tamlana nanhaiensis]KJD33514.1 hypothetical protein PK35_06605 [Tamlana nanhaiensis]
MKSKLLLIIAVVFPMLIFAQSVKRITVTGVILSEANDVEAVTVFNKSASQGTITDEFGVFTIKVALRDVIEISALQFQTASVIVDEDVIKNKTLKIQLIEQVNQLSAVTLNSGLSGYLETDIANVKMVTLKPLDVGNMDALAMSEDKAFDNSVIRDHLTATLNPNALNYLPDLVKIIGLFVKPKAKKKKNNIEVTETNLPNDVLDVYTVDYLNQTFNIPEEQVSDFITHLETKNLDENLLKPENEIHLLEFLFAESKLFLNKNAKN